MMYFITNVSEAFGSSLSFTSEAPSFITSVNKRDFPRIRELIWTPRNKEYSLYQEHTSTCKLSQKLRTDTDRENQIQFHFFESILI